MPVLLPAADLWLVLRAELLLPGPSGKRCEEKEGTLPHFLGPEPDETRLSLIHRQQCIPQLWILNLMNHLFMWIGFADEASNSCSGDNTLPLA